jgi:hypothetical protein
MLLFFAKENNFGYFSLAALIDPSIQLSSESKQDYPF